MVLKYENFPNLPTAKDLPCSDDTPVDNELQDLIPHLLKTILALIWSERMDWFFGIDMGIYYHPQEPAIVPDGFLSIGVPRMIDENLRLSYLLWREERVPILVLEVVSQTRRGEYTQKKVDYAEMGILYYVIYNPLRRRKPRLEVYQLTDGEYKLLPGEPVWLSEIGLGIGKARGINQGMEREWLYWYDGQGNRYSTPEERIEERWLEGRIEGKLTLILRLIALKLGNVPPLTETKIKQLNPNQLDDLALALLQFSQIEDLNQWLYQILF
jgi:Uma2 family endonuclease